MHVSQCLWFVQSGPWCALITLNATSGEISTSNAKARRTNVQRPTASLVCMPFDSRLPTKTSHSVKMAFNSHAS